MGRGVAAISAKNVHVRVDQGLHVWHQRPCCADRQEGGHAPGADGPCHPDARAQQSIPLPQQRAPDPDVVFVCQYGGLARLSGWASVLPLPSLQGAVTVPVSALHYKANDCQRCRGEHAYREELKTTRGQFPVWRPIERYGGRWARRTRRTVASIG